MKKRSASAGIVAILLLFLAIIFGIDPFGLLANDAPAVITVTPIAHEVVVAPEPSDNTTTVIVEPAGWYHIFFTNPTCPPEEERIGGIDAEVAAGISAAQSGVDVAAFDLDSPAIVNALIDLEKRGVIVRVVTDTDNAELSSINRLRRNGISVVEDKRTALMHNKFVIIDERYVWMGSMNLTTNGAYCNNNNFVQFDSPTLAANYRVEMDEMYIDRSFGPTSPDNTPHEQLTEAGVRLENYFASEKKAAPLMAEAINQAQSEILFLAFSFTNDEIGEAMLARAEAGVAIRGVFETVGAETEFSYYPVMQEAGLSHVQVRQDGNPYIMHHKVIILDRETVILGSFNFSDSANRQNDENVMFVHDAAFASYFVEEFEAVWAEAKTP